MPFGRFFSREEDEPEVESENYVEVNVMDPGERPLGKLGIKIDRLEDFGDTERVLRTLRDGHIVFLKIRGLKEKDMGELKRAVEKLKKTVIANNGDIAGVEGDWLILAPKYASVY
ncbi:MAG: cell division protein SepF, partial [Nanoarchaeota archaeon]|nr:cell division protein SepF [Nanoarchaeota archaeon]